MWPSTLSVVASPQSCSSLSRAGVTPPIVSNVVARSDLSSSTVRKNSGIAARSPPITWAALASVRDSAFAAARIASLCVRSVLSAFCWPPT
jgi:hypothetical protein